MAAPNNDRFIYILRILTFGSGVGLIALGIVKFATFGIGDVRGFFLTIYYILFGILVCFSEMPCDRLLKHFYFLKFYLGKGLFFLFLGTITFTWNEVYYLVIAIVLFVGSGFYLYLFLSCQNRDFKPVDQKPPEPAFQKREIEE